MTIVQTLENGSFIRCHDEDSLPNICWNHYGEHPGALEAVYEANQDLSEWDHFLPLGLIIFLPKLTQPELNVVRLWS